MSKSQMGAFVQFCGHNGGFVADIFEVEGANVVVANEKVTPNNILRPGDEEYKEPTHHLSDFPEAGVWKQHKGFFVVPKDQVKQLN